jgi:hypothetical protein
MKQVLGPQNDSLGFILGVKGHENILSITGRYLTPNLTLRVSLTLSSVDIAEFPES